MNEAKKQEAIMIANLISNVLITAIDYFKAKTDDEASAQRQRLRKAVEDGAIAIAEDRG